MSHACDFAGLPMSPRAADTGEILPASLPAGEGKSTELKAVDEAIAVQGVTGVDVNAKPVLGAFFAPPKRKTRLAKSSYFSAAAVRSPSPSGVSSTGSTCASDPSSVPSSPARSPLPSPALSLHLLQQANFWEEAERPKSSAAAKAASRAAWKRRGQENSERPSGSEGSLWSSMSTSDEAVFGADTQSMGVFVPPSQARHSTSPLVPGGRLSNRSATGLQRSVPRRAADDSRCHWLLSPDSLLIRLEPATGSFLMRNWLAYSALGRATAAARGRVASRRQSVPARLHAGWLAETLRPKGWLASIPERERKDLPLPYSGDLVSEPDPPCGLKRQSSAALNQVILREVFPEAIAEAPEAHEEADASDTSDVLDDGGSNDEL